ncbi:MAG: hypothetical protein GYB31_12245 [Bacteroidetes bacterium]|nr:hypothetical protein [Bacteroidota bacterium]
MHSEALQYHPPTDLNSPKWDEIPEFANSGFLPDDERNLKEVHDQLVAGFRKLPTTRESFGLIHYDIHHGNYLARFDRAIQRKLDKRPPE